MELFEQIRREYEFGVGTVVGVSKKLGVHRRMVREAIGSAIPKARKKTKRSRFRLAAAVTFIDTVLEADRRAPRRAYSIEPICVAKPSGPIKGIASRPLARKHR